MEGGGFCVQEETQFEGQAGGFCGRSCCENCGCLSFSQEFYQAFKVMVCQSCRRSDKYKLIPKGTAKSQFMLTDGDMRRLGYLTKPNPRGKSFADMKLYLQLQVAEAAMKKHGSNAAIQDVKQARVEARIASRVERAKRSAADMDAEDEDAVDTAQGSAAQPLNAAQQRVRDRLLAEYGSSDMRPQGMWVTDMQQSSRQGRQSSRQSQQLDVGANQQEGPVFVLDDDDVDNDAAAGKVAKGRERQAVLDDTTQGQAGIARKRRRGVASSDLPVKAAGMPASGDELQNGQAQTDLDVEEI